MTALFVATAPVAMAPVPAVAQVDSGVRGGAPGAGKPVSGIDKLTADMFATAKAAFQAVEDVAGGLGPRFNLDNCAGCHSQPAVGGTSPAVNPQFAAAHTDGATNTIPSFLDPNGPAREVRFKSDGGVHALFTVTGRTDAPGCNIAQPDFSDLTNISFRIPTPVFGVGLVENTPDRNLMADVDAIAAARSIMGVSGHFNHSGNDGTITRFGWKAQNKSTVMFSGEAYNVEMGVTNELFPQEREYEPSCQFALNPNDATQHKNGKQGVAILPDVALFSIFMKLLDAPDQAGMGASAKQGRQAFNNVGCDLCHTPKHETGPSSISGLSGVVYQPFSDFQVHAMGAGLVDGISQGEAGPDEFRTAPLWGVGQRIFFLHDGRTKDLLAAIQAHAGDGSEANAIINNFNVLPANSKQDILDFLRKL
jgi:CxxC motif-containing protein (DUF1111 family)